uniref:Uncharacterized protein n=1 Tax=Arundo donax TaxID=35708 RepID=A0A0A9DH29_ARUDO
MAPSRGQRKKSQKTIPSVFHYHLEKTNIHTPIKMHTMSQCLCPDPPSFPINNHPSS